MERGHIWRVVVYVWCLHSASLPYRVVSYYDHPVLTSLFFAVSDCIYSDKSAAMETIYNLIPVQQIEQRKAPMYRSNHNPKLPPTGSTFGTSGTTKLPGGNVGAEQQQGRAQPGRKGFGRPLGAAKPNPGGFLKKKTGASTIDRSDKPSPFIRGAALSIKPAVPSQEDKPVMGLQSTKNYVTANAVEAILAVPGHRARINQQPPQYRNKVDYGRVPAYLGDVKSEINHENEMIENYMRAQSGPEDNGGEAGEQLHEGEVDELVDALKTKWDVVNAKYQKMCHMVKLDTIGKVRRKEAMENELLQLEKDVEKLEGRDVVVADDYGGY